jgi:hypothetical protein
MDRTPLNPVARSAQGAMEPAWSRHGAGMEPEGLTARDVVGLVGIEPTTQGL